MDPVKKCKKCLLAELDNKKLLADVRQAVARLDIRDKVSDAIYESRLAVCKECDYLNEGTCNACGCYVELRAATKAGNCPYSKWKGIK
jgi:hypothetical protein